MEVTKCWKIVEFPKIKMKTASHLKEIIQIIQLPPNPNPPPPHMTTTTPTHTPPHPHSPPDKILLRLWNKHFLTEIYTNIQTFAFQEMVQWKCFSGTKLKHVCWKICKVRKVFGCVAGTYRFQCQVSWGS